MLNRKIKNNISFGIITLLSFIFAVVFISLANKDLVVVSVLVEDKNLEVSSVDFENKKLESFVILNVLDQSYKIKIEDKDTVYDAMQSLSISTSDFYFSKKEYLGLGVFINEINGVKEKSGAYWIYSVNEEEATVGISKYILKSGDVITWEQK